MLHHELIRARDKDSRRLMVMLPGLGDSLEGYRWLPEAMGLPWMNYVLVNAPESLVEERGRLGMDKQDEPLAGRVAFREPAEAREVLLVTATRGSDYDPIGRR